jgi:hypothetical protein
MTKLIKPHEAWKEVVHTARDNIDNLNDFKEDTAIVWADKELQNYKRAMMALATRSNSQDDLSLIDTMVRRAEAQ